MNMNLRYYDIRPKIVPVGRTTTIRVTNIDGSARYDTSECDIYVDAMDMRPSLVDLTPIEVRRFEGGFEFDVTPEFESVFRVAIAKKGAPARGAIGLRFAAVGDDLFGRLPLKGDLHIHSTGSDGSDAPALVAAHYRRAGFDFMSLTDHKNYKASCDSAAAYDGVKLGMLMLRGEECHCPRNNVHVVNFGSESAIVDLYSAYTEKDFEAMIAEFSKTIDIPDSVNIWRYQYAASIWEARMIRERCGLAIFPHPFWETYEFNVPYPLSRALIESGEFDAYEIYNGQSVRENNYQTMFYQDELTRGVTIPVVGSSDAHRTIDEDLNFSRLYTIVFSSGYDRKGILDAVRDGYCVAVEHRLNEAPRVTGSFRLGTLAQFLLEEYFPFHDEICFGEGVLMSEYARGVDRAYAGSALTAASGRSKAFIDALFA